MKEKIFIIINSKKKSNLFLFELLLFLELLNYSLCEKCKDRNILFLLNETCVQLCEEEEKNICKLENEIIKTQYLNNIIYIIKEEKLLYFNILLS